MFGHSLPSIRYAISNIKLKGLGSRERLLCNDPSLNPADAYSFSAKMRFEKTIINQTRPRLAHLKTLIIYSSFIQCHFFL